MEKYGFVYIWRDRKHNRYYIGSHWGREDDGYVCSSNWMRKSYTNRKDDFKRRVIARVYTNRSDLLGLEEYYLSLIQDSELRVKYYNITKSVKDPWFKYPEKIKSISEKISIRTREAMQNPEVRTRYETGLKKRDNKSWDPSVSEKRRQSMIKTMAEKFPEENRRKSLTEVERTQHYSDKAKRMHTNRTDEQKKEIRRKISETNKLKPEVACPSCGKKGKIGPMKRWHFDNCKARLQ